MKIILKNTQQLLRARGLLPGGPVQVYVARSAIRRMRKYTPRDTGTLAGAAQAEAGGRRIIQHTPYARKQYESTQFHHQGIQTHHWFEAMKANGGAEAILREAKWLAGAR